MFAHERANTSIWIVSTYIHVVRSICLHQSWLNYGYGVHRAQTTWPYMYMYILYIQYMHIQYKLTKYVYIRTKQVLWVSVYQRWVAWCMATSHVPCTCVCEMGMPCRAYIVSKSTYWEKLESRHLFEVMFHFYQHCSSFAPCQAPGQSDFSGWLHSPPTFTPLALEVLCRYGLIPHTEAPGALEGLLSSWRRCNMNVTKDIQEGALINWLPHYVLYKWLQCYQAFPLAAYLSAQDHIVLICFVCHSILTKHCVQQQTVARQLCTPFLFH